MLHSHDLKEPIRKIHFFADRLRAQLSNRFYDEELKYFERIEGAAKRMGSLIDDLLSYSHVSMKPKLFEDVDLNNVIKLVLHDLELQVEEKEAKINCQTLPVIRGHQMQVRQAFQNLVSNALKFNKTGTTPDITITCKKVQGKDLSLNVSFQEKQKDFYLLEVRDKGIGFDQEDAERVFNVFTRLHGNSEYKGSGVGLSIVRKVAENHNGYAMANSEAGKGTCVQVLFPVSN